MEPIKLKSVHGYWLLCEPSIFVRNGKEFIPCCSLFREKDLHFVGTIGWREFPESLKRALKDIGFKWPRSKAYPPERLVVGDDEIRL